MKRQKVKEAEQLARRFRLAEAAARGLRVVPANPKPGEFTYRSFACDIRPFSCGTCTTDCPHMKGDAQ